MGFLSQYQEKMLNLNNAIDSTLENECADGLKKAVSESVHKRVYPVYKPIEYERRMDNGGLSDMENYVTFLDATYGDDHLLTLVNATPPGGIDIGYLYFDDKKHHFDYSLPPGISTAVEAVELGIYNYYPKHKNPPPPRPFMHEALKDYANGNARKDLANGLRKAGFDIK